MSFSDKVLGSILLLLSCTIFLYYSIWVLVLVHQFKSDSLHTLLISPFICLSLRQPFVEPGNPVFRYFLPKEYAVALPASVLFLVLVLVGFFIGLVLIREGKKKKSS